MRWMHDVQPDVVMLQELKCTAEDFPALELSGLGYHAELVGQKTYNGVAILSRLKSQIVHSTLPGDDADLQARYIEVDLPDGWRLINIYVPNGQAVGSDKFDYKLKFYERLRAHIQLALATERKVVIGGDFNVALQDIDVFDAKVCKGEVLFSNPERAALHSIINLGLVDCYRALNPGAMEFSWWDYRAGGFERNLGFRIDYLFANAYAAQRLKSATIDKTPRGWEKPSDHTPVVIELN